MGRAPTRAGSASRGEPPSKGRIETCPEEATLDLSSNMLTRLESLAPMARRLRVLDVSHNRLQRLEGLQLPLLQTLNARHNRVSELGGLAGLKVGLSRRRTWRHSRSTTIASQVCGGCRTSGR